MASVDESAITGESAPVIREAGGDRSAVTGGTTVLSDEIVVRITAAAGESFLDKMIALVEGASRRKTPNEIALSILLSSLTHHLPAGRGHPASRWPRYAGPAAVRRRPGRAAGLPDPHHHRRAAQRHRHRRHGPAGAGNVLAMSGRAVEAAGDVSTLLLDKTGTITFGNRQAAEFLPLAGVDPDRLRDAARWSSLADQTPEGRSIVTAGPRAGRPTTTTCPAAPTFVEFSAQTRMSGVDLAVDGRTGRSARAPARAVAAWLGQPTPAPTVWTRSSTGSPRPAAPRWWWPSGSAAQRRVLGVVHLKDVVKPGMRERFAELRAMGIRTVMITGDNPLTAQAIAAEAGVDDFLAEATPEDKMRADQGRAGRRPDGGDDRRRHQRRPGAGRRRRRGGDELRHRRRPRRPATWSTSTPTRPS